MTPVLAWQAFGRKAAVIAGSSTALISLLVHNTLLTASIRGAIALIGVLLIVRAGTSILLRTPAPFAVKSKGTSAPKSREA
ncbi:MAG: hypothetical protein SGI72_03935 [Planctomycetota bacterium]|nr:hypothetical protein [Planctomycetota bacterium]